MREIEEQQRQTLDLTRLETIRANALEGAKGFFTHLISRSASPISPCLGSKSQTISCQTTVMTIGEIYLLLFATAQLQKVVGESSSRYIYCDESPVWTKSRAGNIKIVLILRKPPRRALLFWPIDNAISSRFDQRDITPNVRTIYTSRNRCQTIERYRE